MKCRWQSGTRNTMTGRLFPQHGRRAHRLIAKFQTKETCRVNEDLDGSISVRMIDEMEERRDL